MPVSITLQRSSKRTLRYNGSKKDKPVSGLMADCNAFRRFYMAILQRDVEALSLAKFENTLLGRPMSLFVCSIERAIYWNLLQRIYAHFVHGWMFSLLPFQSKLNEMWPLSGVDGARTNACVTAPPPFNWARHRALFHCFIGRLAPVRCIQRWRYEAHICVVNAATDFSIFGVVPMACTVRDGGWVM